MEPETGVYIVVAVILVGWGVIMALIGILYQRRKGQEKKALEEVKAILNRKSNGRRKGRKKRSD